MLKEIMWYLDDNRFTNIVKELEGSLKEYDAARKENSSQEALEKLREQTRLLFEDHCVRSGMKEEGNSFINIDAEFFASGSLDQEASGEFIKNIVKGHCYQKVLWTYMGTTGLMTVISKDAMKKQGLNYDDYLPIEYKKKNPPKKPLAHLLREGEEITYLYADATMSKEYIPEKAEIRFDRLNDTSGINWKKGYDVNDEIKKEGWHGEFDHTGTWVRVEDKKEEEKTWSKKGDVTIEIIKSGGSAVLSDKEGALLAPPVLKYVTENGEPYGSLEIDRDKTLCEIKDAMAKMGVSSISAIACADEEKLDAYREVLKDLAAENLVIAGYETAAALRSENAKLAQELADEGKGLELERKLLIASHYGAKGSFLMAAAESGTVSVPLVPRDKPDGAALGLTGSETEKINTLYADIGDEELYSAILANLYASWVLYENSGLDKAEIAALVKQNLEEGGSEGSAGTVTAAASLESIIKGGKETKSGTVTLYTSGIPGVFALSGTTDFYDEEEKTAFLKELEKKNVLPSGGCEAALTALSKLPELSGGKKEALNRSLTRALSQYNTIAMSTGMPIAELVAAIKGENPAALTKKIHYEIKTSDLIREAGKENLQRKQNSIENGKTKVNDSTIVVGGVTGRSLDETVFTKKKLLGIGLNKDEAEKAVKFLREIKLVSANTPAYLTSLLRETKPVSADDLQQKILKAIADNSSGLVSYNLANETGLKAYLDSPRAEITKLTRNDIEELLETSTAKTPPPVSFSKLPLQYKGQSGTLPIPAKKSTPKGTPEKVYLEGTQPKKEEKKAAAVKTPAKEMIAEQEEMPLIFFDENNEFAYMNLASSDIAVLGGFTGELLQREYGYSAKEAGETIKYLRSIHVPSGKEDYFSKKLLADFKNALRSTNKSAALKSSIAGTFAAKKAHSPAPAAPSFSGVDGIQTFGKTARNTPVPTHVPAAEIPADGGIPAPAVNNGITGGYNSNYNPGYNHAEKTGHSEKPALAPNAKNTLAEDTLDNSGIADYTIKDGARPKVNINPAAKSAEVLEREKHKRIEANYENDKAMLAKEKKQTALARKESHDAGHAEGEYGSTDSRTIMKMGQKFKDETTKKLKKDF